MISTPFLAGLASVVLVSLVSFIGVFYLSLTTERLKRIVLYLVSFSAGALLGDVFIHLLPELGEEGLSLTLAAWILGGMLTSFVLEKFIQWRHCHVVNGGKSHTHSFAYINLLGDGIHNFIDGLVLAGAYLTSMPLGIATTLAVVFHEIPQEIGDFGVLLHAGFSKMKALFYNFISGITAVLGFLVAFFLQQRIGNLEPFIVSFAAGSLLYIAGSDLIPELHKEENPRRSLLQLLALLLGIGVMVSLLFIE